MFRLSKIATVSLPLCRSGMYMQFDYKMSIRVSPGCYCIHAIVLLIPRWMYDYMGDTAVVAGMTYGFIVTYASIYQTTIDSY